MAPGALNPQSSVVADANELKDLQSWLKEVEGAESLMTELEAKAESLEAKVDALLADMERIEQEKSSNGSIETEEKNKFCAYGSSKYK
ncbi:hypothetical protein EC973_005318 [Apophysomyces ossiformis]|uniref:Uncharacterized protein n=1 Tax=Apophysomyces ossiformis TaxID=679940 RepID=A0A8H7BX65_9FUNG|nr:hypothetical protein EC973_005318 [Apophysomyces ossiformis]